MWNYAAWSKLAKQHGGPEKLADDLFSGGVKVGRMKGHIDMLPFVGLAVAVTAGIMKLVEVKQKMAKEDIEEAKVKFIEGIKKYDEEHPNDGDDVVEEVEDEVCDQQEMPNQESNIDEIVENGDCGVVNAESEGEKIE